MFQEVIESTFYFIIKLQSLMLTFLISYFFYLQTYKLAIRDLTTVINMDKKNYISFYNRAICYTKIGELQMVRV